MGLCLCKYSLLINKLLNPEPFYLFSTNRLDCFLTKQLYHSFNLKWSILSSQSSTCLRSELGRKTVRWRLEQADTRTAWSGSSKVQKTFNRKKCREPTTQDRTARIRNYPTKYRTAIARRFKNWNGRMQCFSIWIKTVIVYSGKLKKSEGSGVSFKTWENQAIDSNQHSFSKLPS